MPWAEGSKATSSIPHSVQYAWQLALLTSGWKSEYCVADKVRRYLKCAAFSEIEKIGFQMKVAKITFWSDLADTRPKRWERHRAMWRMLLERMVRDTAFDRSMGPPELLPEPINSYANIAERMDLMADLRVADGLRAWWDLLPKDEMGCVAGPVQRVLYARLHLLLVPFGTAQDAREAAAEDFVYEAAGKASLDRDHFYAAAFDLVDMWCDTNDVVEYLSLLQEFTRIVADYLPHIPILALEYLLNREAYFDECLPRITPAPGITKYQNRNRNANPFCTSKDEPVRQTNPTTGVPVPPPAEARKVRHWHYQLKPFSNHQVYVDECMRLNCKPNSVLASSLSRVPDVRDLECLSLRGNHLGCVWTLLDLVAENPLLAVLSLAGAGVRNAGMEAFLQALASHPALTVLDLSDNELLGCEIERPLRQLVQRNAHVQHVRLHGTGLPKPTICHLTAQSQGHFFRMNISREELRAYEEAFFTVTGGEGGSIPLPTVLVQWKPMYHLSAHPKLLQPLYQRAALNVEERIRSRTNRLKAMQAGRSGTVTFLQLLGLLYPDLLPAEVEQRALQLEGEQYSIEPRLADMLAVFHGCDQGNDGCVALNDLERALGGVPWANSLVQVCKSLAFDAHTAVWFDELEALLTRL